MFKTSLRYSIIAFFCLIGATLFAQNSPAAPGNGGPLQNPRPTNSNQSGGGDAACPDHAQLYVDDYVYAFVSAESSDPTYTLPANVPDFYLSISLIPSASSAANIPTLSGEPVLLYVSNPVTTFNISEYSCLEDPSLNFYFAEFEVPKDLLEEILQELFSSYCAYEIESVLASLEFSLVTYNEFEELIDYPVEANLELFECVGYQTSFVSHLFGFCCSYDGDIIFPDDLTEGIMTNNLNNSQLSASEEVLNSPKVSKRESKQIITPNPFNNYLELNTTIKQIRIIDLNGKLILQRNNNESKINTSNLESGIYIIQVFDGTEWHSEKMLKTH